MIDGDCTYHDEHCVMCGMESQCCTPEINVTLCISYMSIKKEITKKNLKIGLDAIDRVPFLISCSVWL